VFDADCPLGIVPIENTLDGYVMRTLDLLLEKDVHIIDENMVEVQFALVGNVSRLEDIDTLYVQFKASGQCRHFINDLKNVKIVITESNMESYYSIKDTAGVAAIVPAHIVENIKDRFVLENVTDADYNHTRFVIFEQGAFDVKKYSSNQAESVHSMGLIGDKVKVDEKVRIPVYIMPAVDRPGLLYDILRRFYENDINLISIMSKPTRQELGTYNFYIEIDGLYRRLDAILDTLNQIKVYNDIKILGIYSESK
jgi:prephenate dehydratase